MHRRLNMGVWLPYTATLGVGRGLLNTGNLEEKPSRGACVPLRRHDLKPWVPWLLTHIEDKSKGQDYGSLVAAHAMGAAYFGISILITKSSRPFGPTDRRANSCNEVNWNLIRKPLHVYRVLDRGLHRLGVQTLFFLIRCLHEPISEPARPHNM